MSKIPIIKKLYDDELLYSWIHRIADVNGLSITIFSDAYLGTTNSRMGSLQPDIRSEFVELYDSMYTNESQSEFYIKSSLFSFEAMWMTSGQQTRYINNVFRKKDKLNTPINMLFQKIHICPECCKEDVKAHGVPYLHRSHHLSGVITCYKHKNLLMEYIGKRGHECDFHMADYATIGIDKSLNSLNAYTDYATDLFKSHINTDIKTIKNAVYKRLKEQGYSAFGQYSDLKTDINSWEHKELLTVSIEEFLKNKMISANYVTASEIIPLLMFLFPTVHELKEHILVDEPLIINRKCTGCGRDYCTTIFNERIGYRCSYCDTKVPIQTRYKKCIETIDAKYIPQDNLVSLDKPIPMYHESCNNIIKIKPRSFLFEGVRCPCQNIITVSDARKAIEAYKGFKLQKFTNTNEPVTIYSIKCGHEFDCRYHKFIKFPGCRICKPKHMNAEIYAERIENLVGDEYTIVKGFIDQTTKVALKHEICGITQEYKPVHFLEGQRCKPCTKLEVAWNNGFNLLCNYRDECGNTNIPKREIYKGFSLGRWCQSQRDDYRNGKLSSMQICKLEGIDFVWDPLETEWNRRYEQYQRYIIQTGSTYISRRTDFEGEHLGAWVETQKKRYTQKKLQQTRIEKLITLVPNFFDLCK